MDGEREEIYNVNERLHYLFRDLLDANNIPINNFIDDNNELIINPDINNNDNNSDNENDNDIEDNDNNNNENINSFFSSFDSQLPPIDFSDVFEWFLVPLPYLSIFLLLFIFEHIIGILIFISHTLTLLRYDSMIKLHMRNEIIIEQKKFFYVILFCLSHSIVTIALLSRYDYLSSIYFIPQSNLLFLDAIFITILNDLLIRFIGIILKCIFIPISSNYSKKKRGKVLSIIETSFVYYRCCLPIPVWLCYITSTYPINSYIHAPLIVFYITLKYISLCKLSTIWLDSIKQIVKSSPSIGITPLPSDLLEQGSICSICQENMIEPVKLECSHIFCEDCVSEWFQRKKTCPLCRKEISTAGGVKTYCDGSTNMFLLIF